VGLVLLGKSLYLWGMKDNLILETVHDQVHDTMEVFTGFDGDTIFWLKDHTAKRRFNMFLSLEDTAHLRDFLDYLLKGTKFDPDQNIS